jgi:hypothetical protein
MQNPNPGGDAMRRVVRLLVPALTCAVLVTWAMGPAAARSTRAPAAGARRAPDPPPARPGLVEGEPSAAPGDPITAHAESMPSVDRSTEGLVVETLPGGGRRVNLQGRFRAYTVVTLGADGALHVACADDPASALALAGGASMRHVPRPLIGPREE